MTGTLAGYKTAGLAGDGYLVTGAGFELLFGLSSSCSCCLLAMVTSEVTEHDLLLLDTIS